MSTTMMTRSWTVSKASVLENRDTFARNGTHLLAWHRISTTRSFTHSNGLRKVLGSTIDGIPMKYADYKAAALTFQKSNPFGDPGAHNCLIADLPTEEVTSKGMIGKNRLTFLRFCPEASVSNLVDTELNKMVEAFGCKNEWPVVMRPYNVVADGKELLRSTKIRMTIHYQLAFKIPSSNSPEAFLAQLRAAGLEAGTLFVSETKTLTYQWWHFFLHRLPEEERYWEADDSEDKVCKALSKALHKPRKRRW